MKDSTFVAGGVLVALVIGYAALHQPSRPVAPGAPSATHTANAASAYVAKLDGLTVAPRGHRSDYDRDAFGPAWQDTDHNGCNQRDDVLVRDAIAGTVTVGQQGICDHDVLAGSWLDPYTVRRIVLTDAKEPAQAQLVQIDHVVPLSEAWSSGAWRWPQERRSEFANDLGELLAVDGPTNASKGDDDPAAWRPRKDYQCAYARRWITVKAAWDLAVDASERRALEEMLGTCRPTPR